VTIALSRSSIRYSAVALAATAALALAGCGSSSPSSRSLAASAPTHTSTSSNPTPTTARLTTLSAKTSSSGRAANTDKGFVAAIPAGFRNATAPAQSLPIKTLYLAMGPRASGLTTNINVVRESSEGMTDINAVVRAELKGIRLVLPDARQFSTPESVTVAGEPAQAVDYVYGSATRLLHLRQVIVEHGGWTYVITYTASSTGYQASLPALSQVISSWRWT
jgi:hypothetical protein